MEISYLEVDNSNILVCKITIRWVVLLFGAQTRQR